MIKRRIGTHQAPRGFTLIEMMLAIGVLALILAMLASSFSTIAHSKVHAEGRLMVDREGRALLWQLSKEVSNAVQTPYALSNVALFGNGHMGNGLPIDTITMSTFSGGHRRAITGMTPETIVTYNLAPNPDQRGLVPAATFAAERIADFHGRDAIHGARGQCALASYPLFRRPALGRELGFVESAAWTAVAGRGGDPDSDGGAGRPRDGLRDASHRTDGDRAMVTMLRRNERGVAMLAVLLGVALMTLIVVDFAMTSGLGFVSAANQANELRAGYLARSGINVGLGAAGGGRAR